MKKGFTLIEVIISIAILTLLILYMYHSISTLKISNETYEKQYLKTSLSTKIHKTLFFDFTQSENFSITKHDGDDKTDELFLKTSHSHFKIFDPYVTYTVRDKLLYRIESNQKFTSFKEENALDNIKFEIVTDNVTKFKIFGTDKSILVVLNDLIFEIVK